MYNVQQDDIALILQNKKTPYAKIVIMSKNFKSLDEVTGSIVDCSLSIDASSDIRRTLDITLVASGNSKEISNQSLLWIDKLLSAEIGFYSIQLNKVIYYPIGIYMLNDNGFSYDDSSSTLSLSCIDLTGMTNGDRGGILVGSETKIRRYGDILDENVTNNTQPVMIRDCLVDTITKLCEWNKYRIDNVGYSVPYDLEFDNGVTVNEIIVELRDLYPAWESFFDLDGSFICQEIPTCIEDPIVLDDTLLKKTVIAESVSNSLSEVFNVTEVFGKSIDCDYFQEDNSCSLAGNNYTIRVNVSGLSYENDDCYGFIPIADNPSNPTFKINALTTYPIVDAEDIPILAGTMLANKAYILKFNNNKFYYQGQFQCHAIAMLFSSDPSASEKAAYVKKYNCDNISFVVNKDNPFCVDKIGAIVNTLSGDDFDNIYTDNLCLQRAEYENWKTTVLCDTITLEMICIPWIDVNQKIEYTPLSNNPLAKKVQYIIKQISMDIYSGTMEIVMINFYPLYPYIKTK